MEHELFSSRHHDCREMEHELFSSRDERKIISIVGMVGIGKTTVARNVYEDPSVASYFHVRAWVTLPHTQHYNKSRMLSQLLQSITPEEPNVIKKGSTLHELEMQVRKCLRGRKYLIVLDNIMSNKAMTCIRQCVPDDIDGSCILLTTRHCNGYDYWSNYIHNMTLLGPKESWELFCNILSIEEHLAPKFEKIRTHVVEKCDGLPQLIVEVAKRLSKCNNIQQGWKKIEKELESLGFLDRNSITVSYSILPHHLKVCFLYFGVFPKRKKILVKMLIRLWIAEGFVKPEPLNHNELEDEAYNYLQELIDGSLLLIEDQSSEGKIKSCRMHNALHSFCVGETQKEALPEQCMYPLRLKKLKLSGTNISQWDLNVIAKLPQLMVLKLENAFHETIWNSLSKGGFPVLIFLLLQAKELKQWVIGQKHFRMLRHLVLRSCNCLEQIPMQFAEIYSLKSIELEECKSSLVTSAKQLQQMRRSKRHVEDLEVRS
nr:putative late blight resistance protein homolog R1A-4 isoform X1 [Ipomoea batatas]